MKRLKKYQWNIPILLCLLLFMIISVITIHSAMTYLSPSLGNLALKQLLWYGIGLILILGIVFLSNERIYHSVYYLYVTNLLLLLALLLFGSPINGSKCWFIIPGIGSFQPSEFMKIGLMIMVSFLCSKWMEKNREKKIFKNELYLIIKVGIIFLFPALLTFLEPDTGAVLLYAIICFSILFVSSIRKRWFIVSIILISILLGGFLFLYFKNQELFVSIFGTDLFYRIDRLLDWKNGTGMQLENSLTAMGSSGLFGHGYNQTPIYFPESGTDFIFAVFASNFGLIGSILLLFLIFYFDYSLIRIGQEAKNTMDKFMIAGITGMLLYQQLQNIGMTLGILPIMGITLPFISYGGSSLLSYMMMMGIVLNIYSRNKKTIN